MQNTQLLTSHQIQKYTAIFLPVAVAVVAVAALIHLAQAYHKKNLYDSRFNTFKKQEDNFKNQTKRINEIAKVLFPRLNNVDLVQIQSRIKDLLEELKCEKKDSESCQEALTAAKEKIEFHIKAQNDLAKELFPNSFGKGLKALKGNFEALQFQLESLRKIIACVESVIDFVVTAHTKDGYETISKKIDDVIIDFDKVLPQYKLEVLPQYKLLDNLQNVCKTVDSLWTQNISMTDKINAKEAKISTLKLNNKSLTDQINLYVDELRNLCGSVNKLLKDNEVLHSLNDGYQNEMECYQQKIKEDNTKIKQLENEMAELKNQDAKSWSNLDDYQNEISAKNDAIQLSKNKLKTHTDKLITAKSRRASLSAFINEEAAMLDRFEKVKESVSETVTLDKEPGDALMTPKHKKAPPPVKATLSPIKKEN